MRLVGTEGANLARQPLRHEVVVPDGWAFSLIHRNDQVVPRVVDVGRNVDLLVGPVPLTAQRGLSTKKRQMKM